MLSYGLRGNPNTMTLLKEYSNKTTPKEILLYSYVCLAQSLAEELLPTVEGNKYREPHLDNVKRVKESLWNTQA